MRAAKQHGSPLGDSVFQEILHGRGLDGALETPQALSLIHICEAINNKRLASFGLISMLDYYTERCVTC